VDRKLLIKYLKETERLDQIAREFPLAVSKLWHPHCCRWDGEGSKSNRARGCGREMIRVGHNQYRCVHCDIVEERSSQRDAMKNIGSEATLISGGNRAGKSEIGCQLAVATAAGRKEWFVQQWMQLNDIPENLIPYEPSKVWVSALSYGDALIYIRPKISKYCPTGTRFIRWKAQDRGKVILPNGGEILSLSADSGREKYQGAAVSLVILDEEHPKAIFDECMLRTVDNRGRVVLTMTPLKGITWPHETFFEQQTRGYKTYSISGLDNPYISSVKLLRAIGHMSEEAKRSRLFGEFVNQQGVVYSEFSRNVHIIDHFEIPEEWPKYRSIDFGTKNPFCCLWIAWDQKDDVLHVYREYYATERTTSENGHLVNGLSKGELYDWTVADPESRDGRLTLSRECGFETKAAPKHIGVVETINWVKERLSLDVEGNPHLLVHNNCRNLIKEFRLYRWSEGKGKDKPIKSHDHALDALRYHIAFHKRYLMHQ
jgi:phage terminase large subunit-like protein